MINLHNFNVECEATLEGSRECASMIINCRRWNWHFLIPSAEKRVNNCRAMMITALTPSKSSEIYFLALFRACSARCLNNTSLSAGWIIRAMSTSWDLHFAIKFLLESTRRSFLIHICAMQHNFALKLLISCVETQNESQAPRHDIAQGKHKNEND